MRLMTFDEKSNAKVTPWIDAVLGGADDDRLYGDGARMSRRQSEMLRSTGKNGQKRNAFGRFGTLNYAAGNDSYWAIAA